MANQKSKHGFYRCTTPAGRASFVHVFEPRQEDDPKKKSKYQYTHLFPKALTSADDIRRLEEMKAAVMKVAVEVFGPDSTRWPEIKWPFLDGDSPRYRDPATGQPKWEGYAGHWFIRCTSVKKPGVVNRSCIVVTDSNEFYAGCYALATVNPYFYDNNGNKGISFGLLNLQKISDGDPFGNRVQAEDDFESLEEVQSAAPTGGDPTAIFGMGGAAAQQRPAANPLGNLL